MATNVTRKTVYLDRDLTPQEQQSTTVRYVKGVRPRDDLHDKELEKDENRTKLHIKKGEGNLCITIEPSYEHLGQFYVNVQFEAQKGEHNDCQNGQNRLLVTSSEWLKELIDEISAAGIDWNVALDGKPCPKATEPIALEEVAAIYRGSTVTVAAGNSVQVKQTIENRQDIGQKP